MGVKEGVAVEAPARSPEGCHWYVRELLSGSVLSRPSSVTSVPAAAVRSAPASAAGGRLPDCPCTKTKTLSVSVAPPESVTVNWNSRTAPPFATPTRSVVSKKAAVGPDGLRATVGPPTCVQISDTRGAPLESTEPKPSIFTEAPKSAAWSGPASAVGGRL